jgi:hypothetical protein
VRSELDAAQKARQRAAWVAHRRLSVGLVGLIVATPITVMRILQLIQQDSVAGWPWAVGWGVAAIVVAIFVAQDLGQLARDRSAHRRAMQQLEAAVEVQVAELLREIIKDRATQETIWGSTFDSVYAPTLVGVGVDNAVSSSTYDELVRFVEEHPTSAIGIAGPRGVGKSTLMEQLRTDPRLSPIGVRIPAPKRYEEPGALVRLIHTNIATEVLGGEYRPRAATGRPNGILTAIRRAFAALLFLVAAMVLWTIWMVEDSKKSYSESYGWRVGTLTVVCIALAGALIGILLRSIWRLLWQWREINTTGPQSSGRAARRARRELDYLRYSSAVQAKSGVMWKTGILNISGEDQSTFTERQPTEADSVERLRQFLLDLTFLTRRPVVFCLDELDKIDKPDDVVSVINGIKDLFHLRQVHVLVSVSTDAMHSFAARGILVRDVFDSAFDMVVQVRRLSSEESIELLSRRATRFSVPAMLFCHTWAGGHPRDLIRAARACVTYRSRQQRSVTLAEVVDAVLLSDITDLLRAAVDRLSGNPPGKVGAPPVDHVPQVLTFRDHLLDSTGPLYTRIQSGLRCVDLPDLATATGEASLLVRALRPYLELAARISEFFAEPRTPQQWQSDYVSKAVVALAEAQAALSLHPEESTRAVRRAVRAIDRKDDDYDHVHETGKPVPAFGS